MKPREQLAIKTLVLLDAHAIIHRAYHALPNFSSSSGEATGGLYGLALMLIRLINELKPDYLVAAYDLPEPTFRKAAFAGYKSGRRPLETELVAQLDRSRDIFKAFNIPIYEVPGFEADDILGTIVEQTTKPKNLRIIIASGDHDTLQLVAGKRVMVYTLRKGVTDTVWYDEPAVRARYGFEPKLLVDYKGLRGDPSDNLPGVRGIGEKSASELIGRFGSLEKIFKLTKTKPEALTAGGIKERVIKLLQAGEEEALFSRTLATIRRDAPIKFALSEKGWREAFDPQVAAKLFQELEFRTLVERVKKLGAAPFVAAPPALLEIPDNPKVLKQTSLKLWLINSELTNPTRADVLAFTKTASLEAALPILDKKIKASGLTRVLEEIEQPLEPILAAMQTRGVLLDRDYLKKLSRDYHRRLQTLQRQIFKTVGTEFNLNSPKQLSEVLFTKLGVSPTGLKKTPGGVTSTRESQLLKLKDAHPVITDILAYRELQKLLSTYIDNLPDLVDQAGALHTTYNQTGSTTGRLSSSNPNLQNLPSDPVLGLPVRRAFVARPGHVFMAADYSQIEMRVLAILSNDAGLAEIFQAGKDIHTSVAARVFGLPEGEVTKEMRRRAKVINFGIIYGMGINALRANLGSTREEAADFYRRYFAALPKIKNYFDEVKAVAARRGYTETMFGRRRFLPAITSTLPYLRAEAERAAMNAPIQGSAADIIKLAMIRATKLLSEAGLAGQAHLILQVHDELIFEVEEKAVARVEPIIKQAMEGVLADSVIPLKINVAQGNNWGEL